MTVPVPAHDGDRVNALRSLGLLDSPNDAFFDEIARLAGRLTSAPIAAVSLVDSTRQWFKSIAGSQLKETPRSAAFCAHTICGGGIMSVDDAELDSRFSNNPLVTGEPFIRSYAGAPIHDRDGHALGTLCAIDLVPRCWSAEQRAVLTSLAALVEQHIEAQRQLRAHDRIVALHETVVATMAEGVVVQTAAGEIRLANPAALSILGLTMDQLAGKTSMDPAWQAQREDGSPFPGEEHPSMVALRTGKAIDGTIMGVARPDGSRKWIRINARPVFRPGDHAPIETVATFTDVTEERDAQEAFVAERQKLAMALDLGAIGVIERDDRTLRIKTYGHPTTLDNFGASSGQPGEGFIDRLEPSRRAGVMAAWMRHLQGAPRLQFESIATLADGSQRWTAFAAEKLVDAHQQHTGVLVALKDIHERKMAELALEDSHRRLDLASRAKDEFLANVSHEIRTPLNGVIGMASALALTSLTLEQRDMVSLIMSSGEVLDRLLNDLLDMSKLDAGKVTLEHAAFDLCAAVVEASQLFEIRADEKGLKFSLNLSREAYGSWIGDKVRIKQIVSNLVSNAIKFSQSGQVQVRLSATGSPNVSGLDWITLTVEDTGPGIPDNMRERIFDRFEQAKNPALGQSGTGLGLSISKSLVSLMGGDIAVSSQPGLGSTFTVRLPLERAATAISASDNDSESPEKSRLMRVLLVDDHPTNLRVVEAMLRAFECDVTSAQNGQEALSKFQSGEFGLILMDIAMPVMDGLGATRAIRALEREANARRTPIAMLTAYGSDQHKREAQDAGADFHIVKPVTPVSLLAGLEKAMRAAKAADAA